MVLHDQGEGYQQTKLLEVGVAQVVKEVFHFQIPYWEQNSIILLVIGPISFLGLDLIDPRSSSDHSIYVARHIVKENSHLKQSTILKSHKKQKLIRKKGINI